jgi:selenocysteine lyase/cysteine desulfurase
VIVYGRSRTYPHPSISRRPLIHGLGYSLDVQAIQADFVVADGHKWLLGPEGLAVFYCRSTLRDQLRLYQYGWHMVEQAGDFDCREWQPARSARRFECGSPNMLGIHALHASLSLLLEVGIPAVSHLIHENATYLLDALSCQSHIEILTPITADRYAGIVTFHHRKAKAEALWQYLSEHGVICAHRGGGIRLSPHFYNQKIGLEYTIKLIDDYMNYILL